MGWEKDIEDHLGEGVSLRTCLIHVREVIRRHHDPTVHYDVEVLAWLDRTIEALDDRTT